MKPASSPSAVPSEWKTLVRAAILEPDRGLVGLKISEAEAAVLAAKENCSTAAAPARNRNPWKVSAGISMRYFGSGDFWPSGQISWLISLPRANRTTTERGPAR